MRTLVAMMALISFTLPAGAQDAGLSRPVSRAGAVQETRPIDIVICLDSSGSMQDLIDSARGRIWDIVNKLATAKPTPRLRVGFLSYGTPGTSTLEQGWVVLQTDLTEDLDALYAKMMALTTDGGDEFVGWVLEDAVNKMSWSTDTNALRLIYVAGNETADLAVEQHNFRYIAEQAGQRGIIINTIYGGNREQGITELWDQVAKHGGGSYSAIDMKFGTLQIATPFDSALQLLNDELNATYLPYGEKGPEALANLLAQDVNARRLGAQSCGSRIAAKACVIYTTASWDLVDAVSEEGFVLADVKPEDLPVQMRSITPEERKKYVAGMTAVRDAVRSKLTEVDAKRQAFLATERMKLSTGKLGLGDAMLKSLHVQAEAKGFSFPEERAVVRPSQPQPEPAASEPPFGPLVQENVDALMAAMPALRLGVGVYQTRHPEFASILVAHTSGKIGFVVGEQRFDSERDATEHLVAELEREAKDLQTLRVAPVVIASPFPYAEQRKGSSVAPSGKVRYRIGGFEFDDKRVADQVAQRISIAVSALERDRSKTQSGSAGSGGPSSSIVLDSPGATVEYLETRIRTIAQTAAHAFRELVRNC
jgi:hypothetical protein